MFVESDKGEALIAIGSNIAPERNVPLAVNLLNQYVRIHALSSMCWSVAIGARDQPRFLNGACRIATRLSPRDLKTFVLESIEYALGRVRTGDKYAAREIDLDIALFGNSVIKEKGLRIPDPDIRKRPFLAIPLAEVAPDWVVPRTAATLREIAGQVGTRDVELDPELTAACHRALFWEWNL